MDEACKFFQSLILLFKPLSEYDYAIQTKEARFRFQNRNQFRNDSTFDWNRNPTFAKLLELESGFQSKPGIGIRIKTLPESCITDLNQGVLQLTKDTRNSVHNDLQISYDISYGIMSKMILPCFPVCITLLAFVSYYKTRNVCVFVCVLSPPAFTDRSTSNLAGRSGMGTENTSRDPFPCQPVCCRGNQK